MREEAANSIVRHLYEGLRIGSGGPRAASLVRLFKTHSFDALDSELRVFAGSMFKDVQLSADTQCLTLLSTIGEEEAWNSRQGSAGHQAIPLLFEAAVQQIPMIARLDDYVSKPVSLQKLEAAIETQLLRFGFGRQGQPAPDEG